MVDYSDATDSVWRKTLPDELARRIAEARHAAGSYRILVRCIAITHSYLHQLARGVRCPSRSVATAMVKELDLDEPTARWLLSLAVADREERLMLWTLGLMRRPPRSDAQPSAR